MSVDQATTSTAAPASTATSTSTPASATTSGVTPGTPPGPRAATSKAQSSAATRNTVQGKSPSATDPNASAPDPYGDDFWKQHGESIFRHPRFTELKGFKQKYDALQPVNQFVEQTGGLNELQALDQYFGPIYRHLSSLGPQAGTVWSQIYPVLQAVLSGEDIQSVYRRLSGAQAAPTQDQAPHEDPFLQHLKPVNEKVDKLEGELAERNKRDWQKTQQESFNGYRQLLDSKFADKENPIPVGYQTMAAELITNNIGKFMPKDPRTGQFVNPLAFTSKEAFDSVWEKVVLARIKEIEGVARSKFIKTNGAENPSIPDTTQFGKTADGSVKRLSREDKIARMTQSIQRT